MDTAKSRLLHNFSIRSHSFLSDLLVAVFFAVLTLFIKLNLDPVLSIGSSPFLFGFIGIVFSSWYGGLRAGIPSIILGILITKYFFLPPGNSLAILNWPQAYELMIYMIEGYFIALICESLHRTVERLSVTARQLHDSEMRYKLVLDHANDLISLTDMEGIIHYVSQSFERELGYTAEELVGRKASELIHPDDFERLNETMKDVPYGKRGIIPPTRVLHKNGSWLVVEGSGSALFNERGQPYAIVSTAHDITLHKNMELSLQESKNQITNVLNSITDAFFSLDNDGHFIFLNHQAEKLLQVTNEKIVGKSVWDEFPEIIDSTFYKKYFRVIATNRPLTFEKYAKSLNKYFEVHVYPSTNGLSVYLSDITHRKFAEEELRLNEERFRVLSESVPNIIWTKTPDGVIDYYNERWYQYTGLTKKQSFTKNTWERVVHPDDLKILLEKWAKAKQRGKSIEIEFRLKRHDGKYRWYLHRAVPIKNENNKIIKWLATSTDINEQKRLDERKDEFISTASHELKTPLTTIKAFTQLLQKRFDEKKFPDVSLYLYKMEYQLNRLKNLTNDLLDVSKIRAGKLEYFDKVFDVDTMLREITEDLQEVTTHKIELHGEARTKLYGDQYRIGQVINNLIMNAIKYSPGAKKVVVHVQRRRDTIIMSVQDFGIGIPTEEINNVFDRFYRINGSHGERFEGMGLGLHIAAEIVRRHKGKIWVDSKEGEGSTFSIAIPIAHAQIEQAHQKFAQKHNETRLSH